MRRPISLRERKESSPKRTILPPRAGKSSPRSKRKKVVLPLPLPPSTAKCSPRRIVQPKSRKIGVPSNQTQAFSRRINSSAISKSGPLAGIAGFFNPEADEDKEAGAMTNRPFSSVQTLRIEGTISLGRCVVRPRVTRPLCARVSRV